MTRIDVVAALVALFAPLAAGAEKWFDPDGTFHERFEWKSGRNKVTYDRVTNAKNTKTEVTEVERTPQGRLVRSAVRTTTTLADLSKDTHEVSIEFHRDGVTPKKKEVLQLVEEGRYTLTRQTFRQDGTLKREAVYDTLPRDDAPDRRWSAKARATTLMSRSGKPILQLGVREWQRPGGIKDGRAPILKFGKAAAQRPEARPRGTR